jgi:hypothetical protein
VRSFHKSTPPASIRAHASAWHKEYAIDPRILEDTKRVRARFDLLDKELPRRSLCVEQTGLCAFCLGRIRPRSPTVDPMSGTTLAHVEPLQLAPRRIFDWDNLVGACPGGSGTARHCDNLQGNRRLYINPASVHALETYIRYTDRGKLRYVGPTLCGRTPEQIQAEFDDILGLNIERLRANRAAILDEARRAMERLGWSRSNLEHEIRRWSSPDQAGYTPYFCVAVSYLQRKLAAQS